MRTFWSEGRCRHDGTERVPPAASGERKSFLTRFSHHDVVAFLSFLVRVLALRTSDESCTMVFS